MSSVLNLLHSSTNQELLEKYLRNQGSHYSIKNMDNFCYAMHCMHCSMPKSNSQAKAMSISQKIESVPSAIVELR